MPGTRNRRGQPHNEISNLFASLNQEQEKHDINSLYEGRLRSHAQNFEVSRNKEDVEINYLRGTMLILFAITLIE